MMGGETGVYAIECVDGDAAADCWNDDGSGGGDVECWEC
jgi:hypothetical protein